MEENKVHESFNVLQSEAIELRVSLEGAQLLFELSEGVIENNGWLDKHFMILTNTLRLLIADALRRLDRLEDAEGELNHALKTGQA